MKTAYKIMVFSWNTKSISLCETLNPDIAAYNRESYSKYIPGLTSWQYPADFPDFFSDFVKLIKNKDPDILVIGFQEDRFPGSYFHSHLLPEQMPMIGYGLVKRTKLMGVGVTSYKGLLNKDPFERGIRVSIYAKLDLIPIIEQEESEMRPIIGNDGQSEYVCSSSLTRSKGGTASYLMLPGFGRLAFICCHLPFNAKSIIDERIQDNKMIRQNALNQSNTCFNNIIENLVLNRKTIPTHVIYFGDFNYRLNTYESGDDIAKSFVTQGKEFIHRMYTDHDELRDQMERGNIYKFSEAEINFVPTCKMSFLRYNKLQSNETLWNTGKMKQRIPSYCDRILYHKFIEDGHGLECTYYDRFDVGQVMSKSDHAAVVAVFVLS
jgi:hypothetical protein